MSTRLHLIEFEDLAWFPARVRDLMTDALRALEAGMGVHESIAEVLGPVLRDTGSREVLDLCSGAGGVLPRVRRSLARRGLDVNVLFTDRYPNRRALANTCSREPEALRFCDDPVDATAIPPHMTGFRTLFTSFHHFRPQQAREILRSAFRARASIAVFEITERSWIASLRNAFTPLACFLITPRIRPRSVERLFLTYVLPIVPLALTWDGFVSNLRTYTPSELQELVSDLRSDNYVWHIGQLRGSFGQVTSYLIGLSKPADAAMSPQISTLHA